MRLARAADSSLAAMKTKDGFLTPEEIRKIADAQAPLPETPERGGRVNIVRIDPILAVVDTNGDGIISAGEIQSAAASKRKLDKDGNGKVTREKAMPAGRGRALWPLVRQHR